MAPSCIPELFEPFSGVMNPPHLYDLPKNCKKTCKDMDVISQKGERKNSNAWRHALSENRSPNSVDQLSLFRNLPLDAFGDVHFKRRRFQRSWKHYAELRGSTIAVFQTKFLLHGQPADNHHVITVIPIQEYTFNVIDVGDDVIKIGIAPIRYNGSAYMCIKARGKAQINGWRRALGKFMAFPLPSLTSLTIVSVIGRGGGGKVFVVNWSHGNRTYALKVINKLHAFKSGQAFQHVVSERLLMERMGRHPFLLPMEFAFQTDTNLFIGTPFCKGGDLGSYIRHKGDRAQQDGLYEDAWFSIGGQQKQQGRLSEDQTRRIAAEIILGLEHLHRGGIVYRDLKPENVFIDEEGHIKIGDYGLAKMLTDQRSSMSYSAGTSVTESDGFDASSGAPSDASSSAGLLRTKSICGTRNYLPPEMLLGKAYSFEADMWCLGIMIYRMLCGVFPFDGRRTSEVFERIKHGHVHVPNWLSEDARYLLSNLLEKRMEHRATIDTVKQMRFFEGISWNAVLHKKAGASIPDVDVGSTIQDALENFELSKLQGITLGECVNENALGTSCVEGQARGRKGDQDRDAHRKNVKDMLIGFEYTWIDGDSHQAVPLVAKRKSAGLLSKLSSLSLEMEFSLKFSPRSSMTCGKGQTFV